MQEGGGEEGVTALDVEGAVDDAGDLRPGEGSGTHGTGLDGDVEGAIGEIFAT